MPYATVTEFDVDWTTHVAIDKAIDDAIGERTVDGLLLHASGPCAAGVRIIDVWESKEHASRFMTEYVGPVLTSLGVAGGAPQAYSELDVAILRR